MITEPFVLQSKTLGALLDETTAKYPDGLAVYYVNKKVRQTWKEFSIAVDTLAKGLMALGVRNGEKVALWATNDPHWLTLMFATAKIGAILVPVNTSYRSEELKYLFTTSDAETIFIGKGFRDHKFLHTLYDVIPELTSQEAGNVKTPTLPMLKRVVSLESEPQNGVLSFDSIMAKSTQISNEEYDSRKKEVSPDDVVNMQFTSGTTGFPKGVMLTHTNILNNGYWIGYHQNFSPTDAVCLPVPFFHCFGCVLGVMACVNHATAMIVLESFDASIALQSIQEEKCTAIYGVPTMFLAMLEHKNFSKTDVSSLRTGIMAGSVCPEPLMRRVIEHMNMKEITICYGLTEGSPVMTQTHADEEFTRRVTTVGRAMPGIEVKIVKPDSTIEVPRNTAGEIICKGYNVMKGYYKNASATEDAIIDNWLYTGDIGIMDDDGYVIITGRSKDMILRGGENIYPREIEEFLSGMPSVLDVQVVGVPSRLYGEEVAAFIIPREGQTITAKNIRDFCKGRIAWQKVPRHFAFVKEFPLTASGKIQKYLLREQATEMFTQTEKE